MKIKTILMSAVCLTLTATWLSAGESKESQTTSAEFTRMKSLVGTWKGITDMGQGPIDISVQYRLLAAGSVLEERIFAGTPNEMITMYYEKNGQLGLTHYCMLGNRPGMLLKSSDETTLKFDFDKNCGIDPVKESHMHALTIRFDDDNTITTSCRAIMDGKEIPEQPTTLKRVDSASIAR